MSNLRVSQIWIHPIKGCRAVALTEAVVDLFGLEGDRRALVVDANGRMITQRTHPRLALVSATWIGGDLRVEAEGMPALDVHFAAGAPAKKVSVWSSPSLEAQDAGRDASRWWSEFLGTEAHLVRMSSIYQRPLKAGRGEGWNQVSFADGAPLLTAHQPSLNRLNDWIIEAGGEAVPMDRFRANVIIEGGSPFEEDGWSQVKLGDTSWGHPWACARCVVTTTDQETGERGKEPLRTLARYRRDAKDPTDVNFGVNWVPLTTGGKLRVGDLVVPTRREENIST